MTTRRSPLSRGNLYDTLARKSIEAQARSEELPLRYRLYCKGGAYNIKCGRKGLIAEIKEVKPYKIERLPMKGPR